MVAPRGLVIGVVVFHKGGGVLRQRVHHAAAQSVCAGLVVLQPLGVQRRLFAVAGFLAVLRVKIAVGVDAGHVVHGDRHRRFDAGIQRGGVQGQAAPAADAQDADPVRIHVLPQGEVVHRRLEILGVDVRGSHVAGRAAALAGEGGVKGQGQEPPLRHGLGVQAGALLLDGAEGPAHGDGRQLPGGVLGPVEIGSQGDAVAVVEGHLAVLHLVAFRERLVPRFGQMQIHRVGHVAKSSFPVVFCGRIFGRSFQLPQQIVEAVDLFLALVKGVHQAAAVPPQRGDCLGGAPRRTKRAYGVYGGRAAPGVFQILYQFLRRIASLAALA